MVQKSNIQNDQNKLFIMQTDQYDYAMKLIVIGDVGVGKTSLISRFITGQFNPNHDLTVGIEFGDKKITINDRVVKLQIWDTAGQQQFKAVTRAYYRSCAIALVIFDMTRKQTFKSVARWVEDVKNNSNKDVAIVMVGSKVDLVHERVVDRNDALKLSKQFEILYIETSAKTHENVQRAFIWPTNNIIDKIQSGFIKIDQQNQAIKIHKNNLFKNNTTNNASCQC